MSPSPFTIVDETVTVPPDLSSDQITATQQVWDAMRQYWNTGAPADYDTVGSIETLISSAIT